MCLRVSHVTYSAEADDWTQSKAWLILLVVACAQTHAADCVRITLTQSNWSHLEPQREVRGHISTTSCPFLHTLSQNEQHVSLEQPRPLPPSSSLASPYLNEHPRHRDGITHFWHFSAKWGMGAKIKMSERAELSGCPPTDSRDTLCSYTACLSKIHCEQTVHWLVLWKLWSVRDEQTGRKKLLRGPWENKRAVGMLWDARMQGREATLHRSPWLSLIHSVTACCRMCVNRGRTRYSNPRLLPKMPKNSSQSGACCSRGWERQRALIGWETHKVGRAERVRGGGCETHHVHQVWRRYEGKALNGWGGISFM